MVVVRDSDSTGGLAHSLQWLGEVALLQRLGPHSWTVRPPGPGTVGVGRSIALGVPRDADPAELAEQAADLIGPTAPGLVPAHGLGTHRRRVWLVSQFCPGMDVRRLVDVVKPSADQAGLVAADALASLSALHARGGAHGRLHPGNVLLGADGVTRLSDWATGWTPPRPDAPVRTEWRDARRADLAAAGAVIAVVARAARCPAGNPTPVGRKLANLPRLLSSSPPAERVEEMVAELYGAIGDAVRADDVRDELAVLVDAAIRRRRRPPRTAVPGSPATDRPVLDLTDGSGPPDGPPLADPPPGRAEAGGWAEADGRVEPYGRAEPGRRPGPPGGSRPGSNRSPSVWSRVTRGLWGLAAALAVLGLVVGLEVTFLHRPITSDLRALRGAPAPPASSSSPAGTATPAVSVAPAAPVRAVNLRAVAPCTGGRPCLVRVLVDLIPHTRPLPLSWTLTADNRCGTGSVRLGARSQVVAARTGQVVDLQTVDLPAWPALNLMLRTVTPVPAAAVAVPVPATGGSC